MYIILLALLVQAPGPAEPPNFSGTWLSISDPNATDVTVASQLPNALLKIVHDPPRFDVERSWSGAPIAERLICDGRQNVNGYSIVVERTTCRWDPAGGGAMVIEGTIGRADGQVAGRLRHRYWLDADGVLHVERTREVFSLGTGARPSTSRYRKVPR